MKPVVAVGGIAVDEQSRVLLIQRGREPGRGLWTVPGGKVELGETLEQACSRELKEETGLDVVVRRHVETLDRIGTEAGDVNYHFVIVDYLVEVTGGVLHAAGDVLDAEWLALDQVEQRPHTEGLLPVLQRAIAFARKPG